MKGLRDTGKLLKSGWLLLAVFIFTLTNGVSQDIQFSQFYSNVLYLNPAFAGNAHMGRAIFHQRLQWPALDAKYITSFISFDNYFTKANSGLGMYFFKDWQGSNNISSTEAALQYSYELHISSDFSFRAGFQGSYVSRYINYSILTFPDQITDNGPTGGPTSQPFGNSKVNYMDISTGGIFYSDHFWAGLAYNHINQPDQAFGTRESKLPYKLDFTGGYRFDILRSNDIMNEEGHEIYLTPTLHYKVQGKSDQLDLGLYLLYHHFITGFWYRGLPILKKYRKGLQNNESIVAQFGYRIKRLSICYSFDATVSRLAPAWTAGSHELNVTYLFAFPPKKKRKMKRIPCPDFNR